MPAARTVNEILQDLGIRRAMLLERFENNEVRTALRFLNKDVLPDVERRLASRVARIVDAGGLDAGPVTTRRLRQLERSIRKVTAPGFKKIADGLRNGLVPFARGEVDWQGEAIRGAAPVQLSTVMPSMGQLRAIVTDRPFEGKVLAEHWKTVESRMVGELNRQIKIGLAQGQTTDQIVRRVRGTASRKFRDGVFGATRRQTKATVRTAVQHTANASRDALYKANEDIVKKVQFVATLDGNTCPQCAGLDATEWGIYDGPRPPMHYQCRCTSVPVLKSWKELGISLKEAPPGTRASMGGQVAGRLSYPGWLRKQSRVVQDAALGPARAAMFRRGRLEVRHFTGTNGRLLSLDELAEVERRLAAGDAAVGSMLSARPGTSARRIAARAAARREARATAARMSADEYIRVVTEETRLLGKEMTQVRVAKIRQMYDMEMRRSTLDAEGLRTLKRLKANEASLRTKNRRILKDRGLLPDGGVTPPPRPTPPGPTPPPRPKPAPKPKPKPKPKSMDAWERKVKKYEDEARRRFPSTAALEDEISRLEGIAARGMAGVSDRARLQAYRRLRDERLGKGSITVKGPDPSDVPKRLKWDQALDRAKAEMGELGVDVQALRRELNAAAGMTGRRSARDSVFRKFMDALERANGDQAAKFRGTNGKVMKPERASTLSRQAGKGLRAMGKRAETRYSTDFERAIKNAYDKYMMPLADRMHWSVLDHGQLSSMKFVTHNDTRAYAQKYRNIISLPNPAKDFSMGSNTRVGRLVAHEWGHHIEYRNYWLERRMTDYRQYRANQYTGRRGELTEIYQNSGEMGYSDGFVDHYFGKVYDSQSTEMFSMGLEHLSNPTMFGKLVQKDPEFVEMMWSCLRNY